MEKNEIMVLELDITKADKDITKFSDNIMGLKRIAEEIGVVFIKAFVPLQKTGDGSASWRLKAHSYTL